MENRKSPGPLDYNPSIKEVRRKPPSHRIGTSIRKFSLVLKSVLANPSPG